MEPAIDAADLPEVFAGPELVEGHYASEDTLHSSAAFLRNTLRSKGFCSDLNLLSAETPDIVATCNTFYSLLLRHDRDETFKGQLKNEIAGLRHSMEGVAREKERLLSRLEAKEREVGGLATKAKLTEEQHGNELKTARKEAEEMQKKVAGLEGRLKQFQHELKRREREFERLQERLSHHLADKKRSEKAALDMAGKLTQQLQAGPPSARGRGGGAAAAAALRSDEGLKAVVAAYEAKQAELGKEVRDLRATLASLQAEYKEALNRQVARQAQDAASSAADAAADQAFLQSVPTLSEEELRAELAARSKKLQRRAGSLASATAREEDCASHGERRLFQDLQTMRSVVADQERLLTAVLSSLRSSHKAKEAQHQADMRRMAQHYQAQLAAAEGEIQAAKSEQAAAAQSEVDALSEQLLEVKGVLQQRAEAEVAAAKAAGEAAAAELRVQLGAAQAAAQDAAAGAERRAAEAAAMAAEREAEREALASQQEAAAAAQHRFELLKKNYEALMQQYAPGVGAGVFLERAVSRKAAELTQAEMHKAANAASDSIPAAMSQRVTYDSTTSFARA